MRNFWLPKRLLINSLLLTESLTDNKINTFLYVLYTILLNKVSWRKENVQIANLQKILLFIEKKIHV